MDKEVGDFGGGVSTVHHEGCRMAAPGFRQGLSTSGAIPGCCDWAFQLCCNTSFWTCDRCTAITNRERQLLRRGQFGGRLFPMKGSRVWNLFAITCMACKREDSHRRELAGDILPSSSWSREEEAEGAHAEEREKS